MNKPEDASARITAKENYLNWIRRNSAYRTFRTVRRIITIVGYIWASIMALIGIFLLLPGVPGPGVQMLVLAVFIGIGVKVFEEISLIVVDTADCTLDLSSRYENPEFKSSV